MASDYQKIKEENSKNPPINYRSIFTPYSDKTHFVYELVQNADDNRSQCVGLQLCKNGLLVWNDGYQFSEEDVRSICSIGFSNKDLTQIGTFGMGFKAVYTYTDIPEVYSGDERFRLPIKNPTIPEVIDIDKINTRVVELLEKGRTVFWLPFREGMRLETEIKRLRDCLSNLEKRSLLFLRNLRTVQWHDQSSRQRGIYFCQRSPYKKMQNASKIALKASVNGNDRASEKFLVFRKEVQPPQEVLNELQHLAEDGDESERIQRSAEKIQHVEVAFKLHDGKIITMDNCVLFSYLPTEKETHLRFFIQARYQTTLPRDNIVKMEDNLWNKWLIKETANFLPEVLEQLKGGGLLEPKFFNVLPLKGEVENDFKPIAEALQKAMQERAFVPTEKEGNYAKAKNVLYPHDELLRGLAESSWLCPNSSWLDPEIQDKKESSRRFTVMQEAGVETVGIARILSWLEKQNVEWFENRCNEWLLTLYAYLNKHDSQLERIKKLPLIRLENGEHVCASSGLAFFPPDTDEEREEIAPFLKELPVVTSGLLEGDDSSKIKAFLKSLGVRALHPEEIINEAICPKYLQPEKPSEAQNRLHVRYLFKFWDKISDTDIKKKIKETPILHAYKGFQQEDSDFMVPCDTYLSKTYTGETDLEDYFHASGKKQWFVNDAYLEDDSNRKDWFKFLKTIGSIDTPKIILQVLTENLSEACTNRGIQSRDISSSGEEIIEDYTLPGLSTVLYKIREYKSVKLSLILWRLLVKLSQVSEKDRNQLFKGEYNWRYRSNSYFNAPLYFDAIFYRQLKETAWLPDEKGNLRCPSECFAPTSDNKELLGDSVAYLHTDFDISGDDETHHQWLAEKLGVHLNADTDSVMNYLEILSGSTVNVEDIVRIYRFLEDRGAPREEKFKAERLIFTPDPEQRWWKSDEVFWEDESAVFANHRGCLKKNYADYEKTLKPFFIAIGISESASPLDYVRAIKEVTSVEQAEDAKVRERIKILYRSLWKSLEDGGSSLEDEEWQEKWKEIREGKCWLGRKGNEWDFFSKDELVWNDNNYIANIFDGKIPFWAFEDEFSGLVNNLSIEGCSQAKIEAKPLGFQERDHEWSEKVRNLHPYVHDFLKSPGMGSKKVTKSADVITRLSVYQVEGLEVTYKLKNIRHTDPKPHLSFLDENGQYAKVWLTSAEERDYAELIGDALGEHFDIKALGGFAEELLTKDRDRVLDRWEKKGLQKDLCLQLQEEITSNGQFTEPTDDNHLSETDSKDDFADVIKPEVDSIDRNTAELESETHTYTPRTRSLRHSGGHWRNTSNRGNGTGGHRGRGGGRESDKHRNLKNYLADNPSLLSQGLKLVETEHGFKSGDKADILLEDSKGSPITVEVETYIPRRNYVGVWQAVKYKHLAAVEYGLPCDQVRSILAAPIIPDDVKAKCKELGIEPVEVSLPNDTRDSIA